MLFMWIGYIIAFYFLFYSTMDKLKNEDDICFICSYWGQRIESCRECLFNVLNSNYKKWVDEKKN